MKECNALTKIRDRIEFLEDKINFYREYCTSRGTPAFQEIEFYVLGVANGTIKK